MSTAAFTHVWCVFLNVPCLMLQLEVRFLPHSLCRWTGLFEGCEFHAVKHSKQTWRNPRIEVICFPGSLVLEPQGMLDSVSSAGKAALPAAPSFFGYFQMISTCCCSTPRSWSERITGTTCWSWDSTSPCSCGSPWTSGGRWRPMFPVSLVLRNSLTFSDGH